MFIILIRDDEQSVHEFFEGVVQYINEHDLYNDIKVLQELPDDFYKDITHAAEQYARDYDRQAELELKQEVPVWSQ